MKEEIYELLKQRAIKYRIISGFDIHQINNTLYYGKENIGKIYESIIGLSEEKDDIEIYYQTGPTDIYDKVRVRFIIDKK